MDRDVEPDRNRVVKMRTWGISAGVLLAALISASCTTTGTEAPSNGERVHWGYSANDGPAHWGALSESFAACREGKSQSPIDIVDTVDIELPAIELAHDGSTLAVHNNGHTLQVDVGPGSSLELGGETFGLTGFHVHSPSEHQIGGQSFALEVHFVHTNDRGDLVVLAVLFSEGHWNRGLETIGLAAPTSVGETAQFSAPIAALDIVPEARAYYRYLGSLTTPPCTEGIRWLVLESSDTIAAEQVDTYIDLIGKDARGLQPLNGRQVYR